jgi:hypothetical protein
MAQWGNSDAASNSVLWAVDQYKTKANTVNRNALYGNTTADALITGVTLGQFGVDAGEASASLGAVTHSGWVVKTTGSGGRAGRVQYETLVAGGIGTDGSDDAVFPDFALYFSVQPANDTANATANEFGTFTGAALSTPAGATVTYQWQKWGGASFANVTNGGAYSNVTTATLAVLANTASNGEIYRLAAANTAAATIYSTNAVFTITT